MYSNFHEDRLVGLTLAFVGGSLDAYTYVHYGAFATAQTGNLILAIIEAFDKHWQSVGIKLLTTLFFCCGIFLAKYLMATFRKKQFTTWRLCFLYLEAILFALVSLSIFSSHPAFVSLTISFMAAMQWVAFDKINGLAYTNLFTTGNLKGLATSYYDYFTTKDKTALKKGRHFLMVISAFFAGAIATVYLYKVHHLESKTILLTSGVIMLLAVFETFMIWRFRRIEKNNLS